MSKNPETTFISEEEESWSWSRRGSKGDGAFPTRTSKAQLESLAQKSALAAEQRGEKLNPLRVVRGALAKSVWGKAWCQHILQTSDYESRLAPGRTYLYSGAIIDVQVQGTKISAKVQGASLYDVSINFTPLPAGQAALLTTRCSEKIDSLSALLTGKLSPPLLELMLDRETGIFPRGGDIRISCSCPDWARMCKHAAAVLYGLGYRIDLEPLLLFGLRGLDPHTLVKRSIHSAACEADSFDARKLGDLFGIDLGPVP